MFKIIRSHQRATLGTHLQPQTTTLFIANCGQTVTDTTLVCIDSTAYDGNIPSHRRIGLPNSTYIVDPLRATLSQNGVVKISRVCLFSYAVSAAARYAASVTVRVSARMSCCRRVSAEEVSLTCTVRVSNSGSGPPTRKRANYARSSTTSSARNVAFLRFATVYSLYMWLGSVVV